MLKSVSYKKLMRHTKVAGVEVNMLSSGEYCINLLVLNKKGNNFEIDQEQTDISNWEQLKKQLNKGVPIALTFNGRGILHKKVELNHQEEDQKKLFKILPNANVEDFYIQSSYIEENTAFLSVVRKEIIDEFLKIISNDGFIPISVSLGPFILNAVLPLIKPEPIAIDIANYGLKIKDSVISDYEIKNQENFSRKLTLGGEDIKQFSAIAFASAFRCLFIPELDLEVNIPSVLAMKNDSSHQKLFKFLGWGILLFFLGILLLNFFLFDYYNKKNTLLTEQYNQNKGLLDYIDEMKLKINTKNAFIETSGLKNASRVSFYADRIAMDLPEKIRLIELNVNPLEKKIKTGEPIVFGHNNIVVKGNSKRSSDLNNWILILKQNDWVSDILVINYQQENPLEPGVFEIKISVK